MTNTQANNTSMNTATPDKPLNGVVLSKSLPLKTKLFVKKYIELGGNATQAYLQIYAEGYQLKHNKPLTNKIAVASASRLLSDVNVLNLVEKYTEEAITAADISVNSVLSKYKVWSEFDPRSVFEWKKTEVFKANGKEYIPPRYKMALFAKSMEDIPEEAWQCIESVQEGRDGFQINVVSKLKANDQLAKYLGIDKQINIENTGNLIMSFDKQDEGV